MDRRWYVRAHVVSQEEGKEMTELEQRLAELVSLSFRNGFMLGMIVGIIMIVGTILGASVVFAYMASA